MHTFLLATLDANLGQSQGKEQANMPGNKVQPELVIQSRASREVRQVVTDAAHEKTKEGLAIECRDANVGRNKPSAASAAAAIVGVYG